jgi:hypothetical protein
MKRWPLHCALALSLAASQLTQAADPPPPIPEPPLPKSLPAPRERPAEELPLPEPGVTEPVPCVEPPITTVQPHMTLVEEHAATTIPHLRIRPEVIGIAQPPVVDFRKEKQVILTWVLKDRDVPHEVVSTVCEPVKITDPVTGECRIEEKHREVVTKVVVKVWEVVPKEETVEILVPYLKPGPPFLVQKLCLYPTQEPGIETRIRLDTTPATLTVPPPPPPPPCLNGACPAPILPN